jgi:hypothetical protein
LLNWIKRYVSLTLCVMLVELNDDAIVLRATCSSPSILFS